LVVAVIISLALMVVDHRQHHLEQLRSFLSVVVYPLQYLANLPVTATHWATETFSSRDRLLDENRQLRQENLQLKVQQQKLTALEAENMRLRDLLDSSFKLGERVLIAELIAIDLDPYRQQVLIDKGKTSGIFDGQPVVDADGVIGQVTHVNPFTARVLMITDPSHALPVQVNRNGLRTIALGTGRLDELELLHLPNNSNIRVGDLLSTSGLGGHFPPGYPVASVTSVTRNPGEPFLTVLAKPNASLDRSREVLLVWSLTPRTKMGEEARSGTTGQPPEESP
jgi:rod shape-determining protein MreC